MDLTRWYLFTLRTITVATVPVLGDLQTVTESVMVAHLEQVDGFLQGRNEICDITIQGATDLARTVLPVAFVKGVPTGPYRLQLTEEGGQTRLSGELAVVHVGYDPALGPLPSTLEDPSVVDTDGDGQPGATVVVDIKMLGPFEIYLAQRSQVHVDWVWSDAGFSGVSSLPVMEQAIIGSEHPLLSTAPVLETTAGDFTLEPLPGPTTCAALGLNRSL